MKESNQLVAQKSLGLGSIPKKVNSIKNVKKESYQNSTKGHVGFSEILGKICLPPLL